jgi:peptidoglycan/LPS O-acetylase OafA/YrhL
MLGKLISGGRNNNLNAIRLFLALSVIMSHSFPLSWGMGGEFKGEPLIILTRQQASSGTLAVNLFFLISGMLITASWLHSKSMQDFLMKRVLRIYPGFIVAVGFSGLLALILCPEFRSALGHGLSWLMLMAKDWFFLTRHSLQRPGIFSHNPAPGEVNGSLWTIPKEFACYLMVALIGLFSLYKYRWLNLLSLLFCYMLYVRALFSDQSVGHLDSRLLTYFLVGMNMWLWRDKIPFSKWIAFGCLAGLLVASQFKPWFSVLFPFLGGYAVLWLGYGPNVSCLKWTIKTDLSYGTYLYAFPVQQVVAMNACLRHPWLNFLISTPITLCLAWLSWHFVEKRFLAMKKVSHHDFDPAEGKNFNPAV